MTTIPLAKAAFVRRLEALQQDQQQKQQQRQRQHRPEKAAAQEEEPRLVWKAPVLCALPLPPLSVPVSVADQRRRQQSDTDVEQIITATAQRIAQLRDAERRRDGREQRRLETLVRRRAELASALATAHRSRKSLRAWAEAARRQLVAECLKAAAWHRQRLLARCLARLCAHASRARAARAGAAAAGSLA